MLKNLRILLCFGGLFGATWAGTYATFTDSATATSTFTAGSVDLLLNNEADDDYAFTTLQVLNLKPGDVQYAPLTIANNGSLNFAYTMATSATNADGLGLRDQLTLGVKKVANTGACDAAGYAASVDTMTASGALSAGAIASRALAAGASEVACFRLDLPALTGNAFQGATTPATFTFTATQS
jgi:predicted ribosomally synthesized peptide with SipW-like signal peptide